MHHPLKATLHDVISGKSQISFGTVIQAITNYLAEGKDASGAAESGKQYKKQEEKRLIAFIEHHRLWVSDIDFSQYISEGAEQRVFLKNSEFVVKLNDSIYYSSWTDYFHSLLLHNFFFPDTAYQLIGFTQDSSVLYAVVQQPFVTVTQNTDLNQVREFLSANGFVNLRNHDYYCSELGIILEDLHDENVLTKNGILYFIDTVFYLTQEFWRMVPNPET